MDYGDFVKKDAFRANLQISCLRCKFCYSHSIVAGGLLDMSYTRRLTPRTLLIILLDIMPRTS